MTEADPMPAAVLFDCDGTLLDSETVTVRAMRAALAEQGHELTEAQLARMVGHPWPRTRELFVELYGMTEDDLDAYMVTMRAMALPLLEDPALVFTDVAEVLDGLAAAQVPLAVVTSSGRDHLRRVLELPPLHGRFAVCVAREDVPRHKPDPLPYARALEGLRRETGLPLPAADVTVVEDSEPGIEAGRAVGCWTVAVDRGTGLHDLGRAHVVTEHLRLRDLVPAIG